MDFAVGSIGGRPLPVAFFIGVLAGEEPIDHTQKNVLREGKLLHPVMERVMAIHVAEEARHISFAHEFLRKRLPKLTKRQRFWISLYLPLTMRSLANAILVPPKEFWAEFDIPREVKRSCSSDRQSRESGCATCSPTCGCWPTTPV